MLKCVLDTGFRQAKAVVKGSGVIWREPRG
jgi:hypothetical protein